MKTKLQNSTIKHQGNFKIQISSARTFNLQLSTFNPGSRDFADHAEGLASLAVVIDIYGAKGRAAGDQNGIDVGGGLCHPVVGEWRVMS